MSRAEARPQGPTRPSLASAVVAGAITVVLVVVMTNLGLWQLRRHAEVRDQNVAILERSSMALPLAEVPFSDPEAVEFQRVLVTGTWQPQDEVLWRGRTRKGVPGFDVLTPLVLEGGPGRAILVDRGFLPDDLDEVPATSATPPTGRVEVEGLLRLSVDQPGFGPKDPLEGDLDVVFHADIPRIQRQLDVDLLPMYLHLVDERPPTTSDTLRPLAPIEPDAGPHLGYALQWFGFSITAIVAFLAWVQTRVRRQR